MAEEHLFNRALEASPGERAALLKLVYASKPAHRVRIETRLAENEKSEPIVDSRDEDNQAFATYSMPDDPDLASLRDRDDVKVLLGDLEKKPETE